MRQNKYEYDAFISHAVEDKIPIANELCAKLERAGLRIWYSGKELGIGDSIEKTIEKGLNRSRYGIVILSPTYLAKNWTIREFYTLLAKEIEEHKVILPVLYNITVDDLKNKDLLMADRFAVSTDRGIDFVVDCLVGEIRKSKPRRVKSQPVWLSKMWGVLTLSVLLNVALVLKGTVFSRIPSPRPISGEAKAAAFAQPSPLDPAFFTQIEGLFDRLSSCSCSGLHDAGRVPARSVSYTPENFPQGQAGSGYAFRRASSANGGAAPATMTMAVVFQIETQRETGEATPSMPGQPDDGQFLSPASEAGVDLRTASLAE